MKKKTDRERQIEELRLRLVQKQGEIAMHSAAPNTPAYNAPFGEQEAFNRRWVARQQELSEGMWGLVRQIRELERTNYNLSILGYEE